MQDDPNDLARPSTYQVLKDEGDATGNPILETVLATPNLRPKQIEDDVNDLLDEGTHPGTTFRGAIGVAIVVGGLRRRSVEVVIPEPTPLLPQWARAAVAPNQPDLWAMMVGFRIELEDVVIEVKPGIEDCVARLTGGRVGNIDFPPQPLQNLGEVTTSPRFRHILDRLHRVATWSGRLAALNLGQVSTIATLNIDRNNMFDPTKRRTASHIRLEVSRSAAIVALCRSLNTLTRQSAERIVAGIKAGGTVGVP